VTWRVELTEDARRELRQLDRQFQDRILKYLRTRVATTEDPRRFGKSLSGGMHGLWRYRVGDYRLVCQLQDGGLTVLVVRIGHRSEIYQ